MFLDLVFLDDLHIRKLQNVRKRGRGRQRPARALPVSKSGGILEIAEEMACGLKPLPRQHLELRNDDRLHLFRVADQRRDEPSQPRKPAAARANEHRPCALYRAKKHFDFIRKRGAPGLIAKRDIAALYALPVLLKIRLNHNRARASPDRAARFDGRDAFDLHRSGLNGPFEDLGLLYAIADGRLNGS